MGLADALISKLAKAVVDNLDATVSSRLASNDARLNNIDAALSSRLASGDTRVGYLDAPMSSRVASTDPRLDHIDVGTSTRLASADARIAGFGGPKLPVKTGYGYKDILDLTNRSYFCFKAKTLTTNGDYGLGVVRSTDSSNEWVTLVNVSGSGHLFGVQVADVSGGANQVALQVIVDGVTVINLSSVQLGAGHAFVFLGIIDAYYTGATLAYVASPNFAVPMFYSSSLQIKYKSNAATVAMSAVYV